MGGIPELPIGLATLPSEQPAGLPATGPGSLFDDRLLPTIAAPDSTDCSLKARAAAAFEGVSVLRSGQLCVDHDSFGVRPDAAARCAAPAFDTLNSTLAELTDDGGSAPGAALRIDMFGPVTLAVELLRAGVERPRAIEAARMACVYQSEAVFNAARSAHPTIAIAVVMVEPGLVGSMHPTFALGAREVRSLLDPVVDALDRVAGATEVLIGIHVPGRADWRTIISSGVSLLSMPPDAALIGWAPWIQALLDNGGHIAWGAVPVDRPLGTSAELLWRHLAATWRDLASAGVDRDQLLRRSLVAPSDGLGAFAPEQVAGVVSVVDALAQRIHEHVASTLTPVLA